MTKERKERAKNESPRVRAYTFVGYGHRPTTWLFATRWVIPFPPTSVVTNVPGKHLWSERNNLLDLVVRCVADGVVERKGKGKRSGLRWGWDGVQVNEKRFDDAAIQRKNWDRCCLEGIVHGHWRHKNRARKHKDTDLTRLDQAVLYMTFGIRITLHSITRVRVEPHYAPSQCRDSGRTW